MSMHNGTTPDTVASSEESLLLDKHEFVAWSNGVITIEDWTYQFNLNPSRDHAQLTPDEARSLRDFLNSPQVSSLLE